MARRYEFYFRVAKQYFTNERSDLLQGNEVVIVPQGPLCLVPYAAFMDLKSKYLCETFRIRLLPSLSSLGLIQNCPADWHRRPAAV